MAGWRIDPFAQALLKPQATLTGRLFFLPFFPAENTADSRLIELARFLQVPLKSP
jgi:hypothetical protein